MENIEFCCVGIDIGKKADPSAIVVAQGVYRGKLTVAPVEEYSKDIHYLVPYLERLPLEMRYPEQVRRFVKVVEATVLNCRFKCPTVEVLVDVTGVGEGVADQLEPEIGKLGIRRLNRVRFTHGDRATKNIYQINLGKEFMANRLQILAESRRVHLDRNNQEAQALAEEMLNFDIEVDEEGGAKYGAMRPGTHDDLVVALALATLRENITGASIHV
jgi:hypothetical protein